MYHRIRQISASSLTFRHMSGRDAVFSIQFSDIYYFVLKCSKRIGGGNTRFEKGVRQVCGTLVVHFPSSVVHAFPCTTNRLKTMYHL